MNERETDRADHLHWNEITYFLVLIERILNSIMQFQRHPLGTTHADASIPKTNLKRLVVTIKALYLHSGKKNKTTEALGT